MSNTNGLTGQNKQYLLWKLPKHPFDYCYLMDQLKDYNAPRDKISRMIKKKEIIQVKKGLYVLSPEFGSPIQLKVLANLIYGPSYISMEYALSYWGLIPEKVEEITSITNKRNKTFHTPVGTFSYKYLETAKYAVGIERISDEPGAFLMASKEKALCDRIAFIPNLGIKEMTSFLAEDLRLDLAECVGLNIDLLHEIAQVYHKKSITSFYKWVMANR